VRARGWAAHWVLVEVAAVVVVLSFAAGEVVDAVLSAACQRMW
jgi:hypothetical protein